MKAPFIFRYNKAENMIKNIVFDLDGVLFDGCDFHAKMFIQAVLAVLPEHPLTREFHDAHLNALPTKYKLRKLMIDPATAEQIYTLKQQLTEQEIANYIHEDKKVQDICIALKTLGYKIFCVSNSIRATVDSCLGGMGVREYFSGVITNEDTSLPKPSPEPYLTLYRQYGLEAGECLVLEDSEYGIQSARASGAHLLPVRDCNDVSLDAISDRIEELRREHLAGVQ
jgi:HAD superfamily hydrolase (TIGR01509 family)